MTTIGPAQPTVVGFTLERLIGEGGFGQVWRATETATGDTVAIKILHLELVRSPDAMRRFERELAAIQRLRHPNVVHARGHGELADGRPYLVLEYVEGPSLRERIHERGMLPPAEMLAILGPLCEALAVAHEAGLVHRDVKASNVILADGGARPVLLDFGLVKLVDDVGPGLTSSRSMLGTPAAMAPEQLRGGAVDARTDVYALGLVAFFALTGQPAFGGGPGVVQSYLQVHAPRPRASSKVDIDPAIDEPIARALMPDPADRFASTRDFAAALRAVISAPGAGEGAPSSAGGGGGTVPVIALYAEGPPADVARVSEIAVAAGMTIATSAPDSVVAVMPRGAPTSGALVSELRTRLVPAATGNAKIALGTSTASIDAHVVDGEALDVEGWAPYPISLGLWVDEGL